MSKILNLLFWQNKNLNKPSLFKNINSSKKLDKTNSNVVGGQILQDKNKATNIFLSGKNQTGSNKVFNNVTKLENIFPQIVNQFSNATSKESQKVFNNSTTKSLKNVQSYQNTTNSSNTVLEQAKANEIRREILREKSGNNSTDIKVDMSGMNNNIKNDMDIDLIISKLSKNLETALLTCAEGVHINV